MNKDVLTTRDILQIIDIFQTQNPFELSYSIFHELFQSLNVAKLEWHELSEGKPTDHAVLYLDGEVEPSDPLVMQFVCNDKLTRIVEMHRHKGTPPWSADARDTLTLFNHLTYIYGSHLILLKIAEDSIFKDKETGIASFNAFVRLANMLLAQHRIDQYAALYINIKNCKLINKIFGFRLANQVLANYAQTCARFAQEDEVVARLGGDNFVAMIKREHLAAFLQLLEHTPLHFECEGKHIDYQMAARAGIFLPPLDTINTSQIMSAVSQVIPLTKRPQAADFMYYNKEIENQVLHRNELEFAMEEALHNQEYLVYYQPKVSTKEKMLVGAEALIRWDYFGKILSPGEFIPLFEQTGFIVKIDFFVLNTVCAQLKKWLAAGLDPVPVSINFSRKHLVSEDLAQRIQNVVASFGIPPKYIEIEFTETAYLNDNEILSQTIGELREAGLAVAMDDFGTGYSAISLLQNLMFNVLKIDKSLIGDMTDSRKTTVLEHIIQMAKDLNMNVVCEGVETQKNLEFLERTQCDMIQGYLFDRPLPLHAFEERLRNKQYRPH